MEFMARPNHWSGGGLEWHGPNVQVEVVVDGRSVDCLLDLLEKRNEVYGPFVAWISNVDAWPVERFSK